MSKSDSAMHSRVGIIDTSHREIDLLSLVSRLHTPCQSAGKMTSHNSNAYVQGSAQW